MREKVQEAVSWTRSERYDDAIEVFEKYLPKLFSDGDIQDKRFAAAAFSFYGLCVAMVKHKYADALKYCNVSIKANFMDPEHRANLALVYLERNERKKAVETLNAGLRLQPDNTVINHILDRIGRRQQPVIGFLSRDNPINVWLGKRRGAPQRASRRR